VLGDGIRRNIAMVSKEERDRYLAAVLTLDDDNNPLWRYSDHVSFFDKQQWVHYAGHASGAHAGQPAGMSWHREAVNRYEGMLRAVDPQLSLHYWDWTTDPRNQIDADGNAFSIFAADFLGDDGSAGIWTPAKEGAGANPGPGGEVGPPFANFETTFGAVPGGITDTPPHQLIWRSVSAGPPVVSTDHVNLADVLAENAVPSDADLLAFAGAGLAQNQQFNGGPTGTIPGHAFVKIAFGAHNYIHHYIGGTFDIEHISARDPIFWLIHSNLDRLWAMWQRMAGQAWRLDPNQLYGLWTNDTSMTQTLLPWNGSGGPLLGAPLIPWVMGSTADDNSLDPGHAVSAKNSKDQTIVIPHSYDTAPHSSYIIVNRDTFSSTEVGVTTSYSSAFFVVYDGFEPKEITANPTVAITNAATGATLGTITAVNPQKSLEDPGGAVDVPQRITIGYTINFTGTGDFPVNPGDTITARVRATLSYAVDTGTGGATVNVQEVADTFLLLVNQPNPYMLDVEGGNPSWLSVDTRVFQVPTGGVVSGQTQGDADTDANAPYTFIQGVVTNFNALPNNGSHPFLSLSADEDASVLQLSRSVSGQRIFNYAVAKVRYVAPAGVLATNVQVFFRVFSTMVSALDYDHTSGSSGNYRRSGTAASSIPLLGIQNGEIASIPFFAAPRIDTSAASMTTQADGAINTRTLTGVGATEQVAYFGCWLDINLAAGDPHALQFPANPPGGSLDGPYPAAGRQTIQTLIRGLHQCLVAEVFFQPAGTDPIPHGATPGSSDRLAQRNLAIVESGNPGGPDTHTIQHTFLVKPSSFPAPQPELELVRAAAPRAKGNRGESRGGGAEAFAAVGHRILGPDELMIRWNNIPRDSVATFYLPEIDADEILGLAELRQRPQVLEKVDAHTIGCRIADITYLPLPGGRTGFLAGLLSLTLPPGVRSGQLYRLDVQQYSGITRKILGAFQVSIPVATEFELLPKEIRKLSVLRHIQQSIPFGNRWYPIFVRYLDQVAARVRGFGGDPNAVKPDPDGGEGPIKVHPPKPVEVCPPDLWCLPIPWGECELEGEIDVKIRFRRRCD
jgi:hypothetical protein